MRPVDNASGLQQVLALRQQIMERSDALKSLQQPDAAKAAAPSDTGESSSFADTLTNAVQEVNSTQQRASDMAAAYERGEITDVAQVMLARQEAGVAFEATLQVRNKLLSAYQDIMRLGA